MHMRVFLYSAAMHRPRTLHAHALLKDACRCMLLGFKACKNIGYRPTYITTPLRMMQLERERQGLAVCSNGCQKHRHYRLLMSFADAI